MADVKFPGVLSLKKQQSTYNLCHEAWIKEKYSDLTSLKARSKGTHTTSKREIMVNRSILHEGEKVSECGQQAAAHHITTTVTLQT